MKIKIYTLLILCAIFTFSCKKAIKEPEPQIQSLSASKYDLFPMEVAIVNATGIKFASLSYEGSMGGKSVKLGVDTMFNIMSFITPYISEGAHTLSVTVSGTVFTVSFHIKTPTPVADVNQTINNTFNALVYTNAEFDSIYQKMKDFEGNSFCLQNITMIKNYNASVQQTIANLNMDEKMQLADFIYANPVLFAKEDSPLLQLDSFSLKISPQSPEQILDNIIVRMKLEKKKLVLIAAATVISAAAGQPWLAAVCGLAGIYKIYQINDQNIADLGKALLQFGNLIADDIKAQKNSAFSFNNEQKYLMKIKSAYRNPNNGDVNNTSAPVTDMISVLNEVGSVWQIANNYISTLGFSLQGSAFHIKNITQNKSKIFYVNPQLIAVSNISNPNVTASWQAVSAGWEMTFNTTAASSQPFTFDIKYTSPTSESTLSFNGTVQNTVNVVMNTAAPSLTMPKVILGGTINDDGGLPVTERGICYATVSNPTTAYAKVALGSGIGIFTTTLNLSAGNTTYYVRAYATNSIGTTYGNQVSFITPTHWVGKNFGGGLIYYLDGTGIHGLIAAPSDQATIQQFGCQSTPLGCTGTAIGTGQANTTAIVNNCTATAIPAKTCNDLILNGYSDWYLPSIDELYLMYTNLHTKGLGGFYDSVSNASNYWSSTEQDDYAGWSVSFYAGQKGLNGKNGGFYVRATRSF